MKAAPVTMREIRDRGHAALLRELGPVGYVRFLQELRPGVGDYTKDRDRWLDGISLNGIRQRLARQRAGKTTAQRKRPSSAQRKVEKLHRKVVSALRQGFPDLVERLDEVPDTERITGLVISSAFDGLSHKRRQRMLDATLKKALTRDEFLRVGPIATMSLAEATVKA